MPGTPTGELHGAALRGFFRDIYRDAPALLRWLSMWRPSISPFEPIVAQVPAGARTLDVGCGTGALLLYLAGTGRIARGEGYDISKTAIASANAARENLPDAALQFSAIESFDDLPNDQCEAVLMIDVLHHVPPPLQQAAIAAAVARVAPGGRFIYKDIVWEPVWRRWANSLHDLVLARQIVSYVPLPRVAEWARAGGLERTHHETYTRLIYGHELAVFTRPR